MPEVLRGLRFASGSYDIPEQHYFLLYVDPNQTNDSRLMGAVHRRAIRSRIDSVKKEK